MNRDPIFFGVLSLLAGLVTGYLIYAYPEGLNPDWPIWMALLAPAVFALAGLHMIAGGLGYPRFSMATIRVIVICLWAIVNWAAFFSTRIHCVETVSFLGIAIFNRYPSDLECQMGLRAIVACIDALVVFPVIVFAWRKLRKSRIESAKRLKS
ncbi:MAG: hypothetical protein KAX84_17850 [Burkholderiales bacterium]|nr:hypothetical protein [Burkholderiales bacterium]